MCVCVRAFYLKHAVYIRLGGGPDMPVDEGVVRIEDLGLGTKGAGQGESQGCAEGARAGQGPTQAPRGEGQHTDAGEGGGDGLLKNTIQVNFVDFARRCRGEGRSTHAHTNTYKYARTKKHVTSTRTQS